MYRLIRRSGLLGPILALVIACLVIVSGFAGTSDADQEEGRKGHGGFDFFVTDSQKTSFGFQDDTALPAGFFDKDSARFEGRVVLQGSPLKKFRGRPVGKTDTILERKSMPKLGPPYPSRGTTELEVVALSLKSMQPIQVQVGGKIQLWDLELQLSPNRPSSGKATIVQRGERGGSFSSDLTVFGLLKFIRRGDGAERTLDFGKDRAEARSQALTLRASDVPWERRPPEGVLVVSGLSDDFFALPDVPITHRGPNYRHTVRVGRDSDL